MTRKKFPIGIQTFEDIRNNNFIYIDKTDLIYKLAHTGKFYFLSRPRRFGKSLLISTLEAYFLGKKELFKGLAIEKLETEWTEHPVIWIDFCGQYYEDISALKNWLGHQLGIHEKKYGLENCNADVSILGYHFSKDSIGVYNPFSLLNVFSSLQLEDFWFQTGTPTFLLELLKQSHYDVTDLEGVTMDSESLSNYSVESDDPIPIFYQSGYLTIKGYKKEFDEYVLGYPNNEVRKGFLKFIAPACHIFIFEFKLDRSANEALCQIEARHYADRFLADARTIVKIGVNFTSADHQLESWKIAQ